MVKFFRVPFSSDDNDSDVNRLQKYIQNTSMKDMAQFAKDINPEVKQMIGMNVQALLGYLPASEFQTTIMTSKEGLQNLLASAMLTGYFMHTMEQRMILDQVFDGNNPKTTDAETETLDPSENTETTEPSDSDFPSSAPPALPEQRLASLEELLRSPSELFSAEQLQKPEPTREIKPKKGKFLTPSELLDLMASKESSQDEDNNLNIQLEINTQMKKMDLNTLLKELKSLKDALQEKKPSEPDDFNES